MSIGIWFLAEENVQRNKYRYWFLIKLNINKKTSHYCQTDQKNRTIELHAGTTMPTANIMVKKTLVLLRCVLGEANSNFANERHRATLPQYNTLSEKYKNEKQIKHIE